MNTLDLNSNIAKGKMPAMSMAWVAVSCLDYKRADVNK